MSSASIKKIISCKKNQLIEMVLDIEKYPEFVPWCIEGKRFDKKESKDLMELDLLSKEEYEKLKEKLIPIILN